MAILGATTLTGCNSIPDFINTGTIMKFQKTNAPTSWTKLTTHNDATLRVVSGAAASGGTANFSATFTTVGVTGTVGGTTLATSQIPSHTHTYVGATTGTRAFAANPSFFWRDFTTVSSGAEGGGTSHAHPVSVNSLDFNVKYVDVIIASKN